MDCLLILSEVYIFLGIIVEKGGLGKVFVSLAGDVQKWNLFRDIRPH